MVSKEEVENSIDKGLNFLYQNQLAWGEFRTLASFNPYFLGSYFDPSPFATGLLLYSISEIKDSRVEKIKKKAVDFLLSEKEEGGVWRFWTSRNKKFIIPDLDDISVISFALKREGVEFEDNLPLIRKNRNEKKLFLTWLAREEERKKVTWWIDKIYKIYELAKRDIDGVVNANVLIYLGENDPSVCSFLNQLVKTDQPFSIHYPSKLAFFYTLAKAYKNKITCLEKSREKIVKSVLSFFKPDGSFGNELETALALNTLLDFSYFGKEIERGMESLIKRQKKEGCWKKRVLFLGPFPYRYYGSEELTTGFVLEVFQKYLKLKRDGEKRNN
jgi:hypothetical protein